MPDTHQLEQPLLPTWRRLRALFNNGEDLSLLRALEYEMLATMRFSGRVLDFGGGSKANYRERMGVWMAGCTYETANIDPRIAPTYLIGSEDSLPIQDDCFDAVITLNTLEHIYEIEKVLRELARVLKQGGAFIATVPFLFRIHGHPDDFLRGTPTWWGKTLTRAGFCNIVITPLLWGPMSTGLSVVGIPGPLKRLRMYAALVLDLLYARRLRAQGTLCNAPLGFLISASKGKG
jgi:SAM-dependent methyltransferase